MLVVITIIGLIMALVGPRVLNYLSESKVKTARIQIESFTQALDLYYLDNGHYPSSSEGLSALVQRPGNADVLERSLHQDGTVPTEPWGRALCLPLTGDHSPYEISSYGSFGATRRNGRRRRDQERLAVAAA